MSVAMINLAIKFQSTPSVGRATNGEYGVLFFIDISIHALRGEGDAYAAGKGINFV